jgi:hypothetical protein
MVMWTVLTWLLIPFGVRLFGFDGVALASILISATSFIPYFFIPKSIKIDYKSQLARPVFITLCMSIILIFIKVAVLSPLPELIISIISGVVVFGGLSYLLLASVLRPYIEIVTSRRL